ncbi:MAG TPA: carboxypeptidase-like regulatory domain-containing protein, partial [Chitinophagaceae bacterium]|nr:carboxypeptidase-like regulatory domain-containing protein [Chitinophagaceae bacterium]
MLFQTSFAQTRSITGRVVDPQGAGVPGVTVSVRGTQTATQTGADGSFTIQAEETATLVFSGVGFTTREVSAGSDLSAVALQTATTNLNEVVVVGYGTARRRDV